MSAKAPRKWWQEATGYQIWPASFKDSNHDGVGDINGITSKLDYLRGLGVDLIWLSPVYDSPQHDLGYDIRNYEAIWPQYGSLEDMDTFIRECKVRGIRIIMDLVVNHTSLEHEWFLESRSSRTNGKADWYIWRDPKRGPDGEMQEPNNWRAGFGGSVWEYAPERDQYYLHLALPEQPDLNWQSAETRQAIYESAVDFWLRKGVDGFRVDVVNFYWKDPSFPDAKVTVPGEAYQPMEPQHILNGPEVHIWLQELRTKITEDHGDEIMLIGELPATGKEEVLKYISQDRKELDMVFDFDTFMAGNDWNAPLHERKEVQLPLFKQAIAKAQGYFDPEGKTWPTAFLESHDYPRSVSYFGPGEDEHHERAAQMLALLSTTLSGTLFIYQGQELGMSNVPGHWTREHLKDKAVFRYFDEIDQAHPNDDVMREKALKGALRFGRDNARTPVQWSAEPHAGFSMVEPWIAVNTNYTFSNAEDQAKRGDSVLSFWKHMLTLRKQHPALFVRGEFSTVDVGHPDVFAFVKSSAEIKERLLVWLNFSSEQVELHLPDSPARSSGLLVSNLGQTECEKGILEPWEGVAFLDSPEL